MTSATDRDVQRLLDAIATADLLSEFSQSSELRPSHLPVALVHAVHDVPPSCEDEAAAYANQYAMIVGAERVREDRWTLPPREIQHTLEDLCARVESVGVPSMESILDSHTRRRHRKEPVCDSPHEWNQGSRSIPATRWRGLWAADGRVGHAEHRQGGRGCGCRAGELAEAEDKRRVLEGLIAVYELGVEFERHGKDRVVPATKP